jgi:5-(carboxyamino)imidazole ribonucleotide mutase
MGSAYNPLVAVIMGSHSDLPTMRESETMLDRFGVPYVTRISSAHRAAKKTHKLAEDLEAEGIRVFIVGAGLAAHLAGAIASVTTRPVIGVPMGGGNLEGVDALYSTVQMPSGIPVATMAIGKHGARNAAILAVQILALEDEELAARLRQHREEMELAIEEKDREVSSESLSGAAPIGGTGEGKR